MECDYTKSVNVYWCHGEIIEIALWLYSGRLSWILLIRSTTCARNSIGLLGTKWQTWRV